MILRSPLYHPVIFCYTYKLQNLLKCTVAGGSSLEVSSVNSVKLLHGLIFHKTFVQQLTVTALLKASKTITALTGNFYKTVLIVY